MSDTNIPVSNAVYEALRRKKVEQPRGTTFDDVLREVLDIEDVEA